MPLLRTILGATDYNRVDSDEANVESIFGRPLMARRVT